MSIQHLKMLTFIFFLFCTLSSYGNAQNFPFRFDLAINRLHQYQNFSSGNLMQDEQYAFTVEEIMQSISTSISDNNTNVCEQDFELLFRAVLQKEMWAIKVLDAWGKPLPSGILKGNTLWIGNYDECIQPMYIPTNKTFVSQPFDTQHCTITPKTAQTDVSSMPPIILGICVPSSCDHQAIVSLIHKYITKTNITADEFVCSNDPPNGQKGLTGGAIAVIVVLALLGLLVSLGTILDLILISRRHSTGDMTTNINGHNNSSTTPSESVRLTQYSTVAPLDVVHRLAFLAEFSALRTLRRIFTMKQKKDNDSYPFINGIRVLSLCWVIIGHSVVFGSFYASNILDLLLWTRNVSFQLLVNAVFSVDTFFVLSGFLTAILFVREVKKQGKLSFRLMVLYYIHRYIRLTPTFLLVVFISIHLTPYFGDGPVYPTQQGFEVSQCRTQYWWTSILYVGNIVKPDYMCLGIAWYLHNDMQFHWIAPLSLIPFVIGRKPIAFFMVIIFILTGSVSILTILLYYPNMSINGLTAFGNTPGPTFFKNIYITPWCRISAYAVGILTGYIFIEAGRLHRTNKCMKIFFTILVILFALACLFVPYPDFTLASGLSRSVLVTYQALSRTLWSVVIGWLLFLCGTNQGGIVNKILSWPIWLPFSRLNYSCYLIHATIIYITIFNQRMPFYYQGHLVVNSFVSTIIFSYATAVVVTVFIETPFFVMEKMLFKR